MSLRLINVLPCTVKYLLRQSSGHLVRRQGSLLVIRTARTLPTNKDEDPSESKISIVHELIDLTNSDISIIHELINLTDSPGPAAESVSSPSTSHHFSENEEGCGKIHYSRVQEQLHHRWGSSPWWRSWQPPLSPKSTIHSPLHLSRVQEQLHYRWDLGDWGWSP